MQAVAGILAGVAIFGGALSIAAAEVTIEEAKMTALASAGVSADKVIFKQAVESVDDGMRIYEIDFFVPGEVKYDFDIDVDTGAILDRDMDLWEAEDDFEYAALIEAAAAEKVKNGAENNEAGEITELQAKTIALKDAGFMESEVMLTKCSRDLDDGAQKFEVEFRLSNGMEYSYDIRISDGKILERDIDRD